MEIENYSFDKFVYLLFVKKWTIIWGYKELSKTAEREDMFTNCIVEKLRKIQAVLPYTAEMLECMNKVWRWKYSLNMAISF
jgi:hypothetical protein